MRAMVNINGYDVPEPSTYASNTATIVDSARNVQGVVIGAVIRHNVAKATMTWRWITPEKWAELLARFDPTRGGSFYNKVTLYLQDRDEWDTRTMYVSDRSANVYTRNADGSIKGYTDATFSLVEV